VDRISLPQLPPQGMSLVIDKESRIAKRRINIMKVH
jgi:hypothetical protein